MEDKSTHSSLSDLLDVQLDQVSDSMPFLLLFVTTSIAAIAYLISKFLVEGAPDLHLLSKIVLTLEFFLLLAAAGNAVGSSTARLIRGEIVSRKCALLLAAPPSDTSAFIDAFNKTVEPLSAKQSWHYRNSYIALASALLIGTAAALIRESGLERRSSADLSGRGRLFEHRLDEGRLDRPAPRAFEALDPQIAQAAVRWRRSPRGAEATRSRPRPFRSVSPVARESSRARRPCRPRRRATAAADRRSQTEARNRVAQGLQVLARPVLDQPRRRRESAPKS